MPVAIQLLNLKYKGLTLMTTRGGVETRCSETETRRDFWVATSRRDETLPQRDRDETRDFI